jgi:putative N6-adenine-specific DNA methylase
LLVSLGKEFIFWMPMNLEKQIKRHIIGRRQTFFASALPGFEPICRRELEDLSDTVVVVSPVTGGVVFTGRVTDMYRANLHLHTAGRILMRLVEFKATNFRRLVDRLGVVPWHLYLHAGVIPQVKVATHHSRLYHTRGVADRVRQTIGRHWQAAGVAVREDPYQTLYIRMQDDLATLSIDSSGEPLYRRGLKIHQADAPLRETTAAAILLHAGFKKSGAQILLDPMCGSGTFSLEAALLRKKVAPGLTRRFAFMQWPSFRRRQWNYLTSKAEETIQRLDAPVIHASDADVEACRRLAQQVHRTDLTDAVRIRTDDFFQLVPDRRSSTPALVVLNPPYGRRLDASGPIRTFYACIESKLCAEFKGWRTALIVPQRDWMPRLAGRLDAMALSHGGLSLTLFIGTI